MINRHFARTLPPTSIARPQTQQAMGTRTNKTLVSIFFLSTALLACADSPCPEGLIHAGDKCISANAIADGAVQGSGGSASPMDGSTRDATPLPDGSVPDGAIPDGAVPDGAIPDGAVPDSTIPDPCLTAACGENSLCSFESGAASCKCIRGYIEGALGCERDECQALADEDSPACGSHASCEDPTAEAEDFECTCTAGFDSCDGEGDPEPGCETNLQNHPDHCGACGYACAGDLNCIEGRCEQAADRLVLALAKTCVLSNKDGAIYDMKCAGSNQLNMLNRGEQNTGLYPTLEGIPGITGSPKIRDISIGGWHVCAIPSPGHSVLCWGENNLKQTGSTDVDASPANIALTTLPNVVELALGHVHSCALTDDGQVHCWGFAADMRLGRDYNSDPEAEPILSVAKALPVPNLGQVAHIAAGSSSTCALGQSGAVNCWGALHAETRLNLDAGYLPTLIADTNGQPIEAEQVSVGGPLEFDARLQFSTHCARLKTGRVSCWGLPHFGLIGGDETVPMSTGTATDIGLSDIVDISVGGHGACAVDTAGDVYCWGSKDFISNRTAACSPGNSPDDVCRLVVPPTLTDVHDAIDVEVGQGHACARKRNGEVVCWGNNMSGELGIGTISSDQTPVGPVALPNYP